ncbi:hypothetical protein RJ641_024495 [Dillenia turbinata]|uniref:Uncharacterized protein n=1 Tax=Dillenia turbinata TaxID=194707 RepID=A0AAN8WBC2_9MAGN
MSEGGSEHLPQGSLLSNQDDKFFSMLPKKEPTTMACPSFRVYYGDVSGAVPFMWESRPGTPKNPLSETSIPPLTPPPSYYYKLNQNPIKKHSRSNHLLSNVFPKITRKKAQLLSSSPCLSPSLSSSSSTWSSSSHSTMSTPSMMKRSRFPSPRSSYDSRVDDEEIAIRSPTSTLCFGMGGENSIPKLKGCHSIAVMKRALLSMVSHRSGEGN